MFTSHIRFISLSVVFLFPFLSEQGDGKATHLFIPFKVITSTKRKQSVLSITLPLPPNLFFFFFKRSLLAHSLVEKVRISSFSRD